jgi:cell volume regulation protein A
MTTTLNAVVLIGAAVALVAVVGVRLAARLGVPSLLLYLGIGMLLGHDVIGVRFDNVRTARDLGLIALGVIIAEGGLTSRWSTVRPVLFRAFMLSTVGVAICIAVTTVAAHAVLGSSWRTATLAAAMLASTDAAAVFSTLRQLRLRPGLIGLLEVESGINDAPVVILVTVLSARHAHGTTHAAVELVYQLAVGTAIGVAVGVVAQQVLLRAALPAAGLYPVAAMALVFASYSGAGVVGASGFVAVYATALMIGNARLPHRRATLGFAEGLAWLAQIGLFVMLGLLATPSRLGSAVLPALAIGSVILFLARPLSVFVSSIGAGMSWQSRAFCSLAGLRGAVPIVLASIPLTSGYPDARRLFDVVFLLVGLFTVIQAPALGPIARRLGLATRELAADLEVEAAPLDDLAADLLTVRIPTGSRLHGVEVWELRLPEAASVSFVVRAGHGFVPQPRSVLRQGDDLLIITDRGSRDAVEARIRTVSRFGRVSWETPPDAD